MNILCLADQPDRFLWCEQAKERLKDADLILSAGDLSGEYLSFLTCFTHAPILYVCGNQDSRYEQRPPEGCECVEDKIVTHQGVRVLGLGGSVRYKPGPYQYDEAEMRRRIRKLRWDLRRSGGFDILLTHAPARGYGDGEDRVHRGFLCFNDLIERYHPAYHIYGHIHKEYSGDFKRLITRGDTTAVNAYERYAVQLPPPAARPAEPARIR